MRTAPEISGAVLFCLSERIWSDESGFELRSNNPPFAIKLQRRGHPEFHLDGQP